MDLAHASHRGKEPLTTGPITASSVFLQASVGCETGYAGCGGQEPIITDPKGFAEIFPHVFEGSTQCGGSGDGRNDSLGLAVNDLEPARPEGGNFLDSRLCGEQIW
jgi:hypothetical protein